MRPQSIYSVRFGCIWCITFLIISGYSMIVPFNYQSVLNHSEMYKSITRSVQGRNASEAQIVEGQCIFWTESERQVFVQKSNTLLQGVPKSDFQNAVEAQKSEPILSAAGLNFRMDMTWEHVVPLSCLVRRNDQTKYFHTHARPGPAEGSAGYWWLRGCTWAPAAFWKSLFWGHPVLQCVINCSILLSGMGENGEF